MCHHRESDFEWEAIREEESEHEDREFEDKHEDREFEDKHEDREIEEEPAAPTADD